MKKDALSVPRSFRTIVHGEDEIASTRLKLDAVEACEELIDVASRYPVGGRRDACAPQFLVPELLLAEWPSPMLDVELRNRVGHDNES